MEIQIKSPTLTDWQVIQKLNNEVFQADKDHDEDLKLDWPFSEKGIAYYKKLAEGSYGKCFIAYLDDEPVGYVALAIKKFGYRTGKYVEVENIGVSPKFRGQGIGKKLMEKAGEWAKGQRATKLYVSAYSQNTKAISFYKTNGFETVGVELEKEI